MTLKNRGVIKTAQFHAQLADIPVPTLREEYVLVRTIAVALNPTDWQTVDESLKEGRCTFLFTVLCFSPESSA
jgi:NADPH:quinone reductase-like Zn-dependent oxidoreductase